MKFCEIFTKIPLELPQHSQKPLFKCKKLVLNTTKCDLCLFPHKMCYKMVWKFCEIWKILLDLASRWAKFCEILSHIVRYGMYDHKETSEKISRECPPPSLRGREEKCERPVKHIRGYLMIKDFLRFFIKHTWWVLIRIASTHTRSLARTAAARWYKQWVKRNLQTESWIPGPSEWLGMDEWMS